MTRWPSNGVPTAAPGWYAAFSCDPSRCREEEAAAGQCVRIGPLRVFLDEQGCEISTFGSADDPSCVIFDGYLFDQRALAETLGLEEGHSTSELVAAGYARWGAGLFDELDGCYLIAVWDSETRTLLLGHDALGRHPVFYAPVQGTIWFSSNILALASSGRVPKEPNRLSLALGLLLYWPEAGQTYLASVRRAQPGHYVRISGDGHAVEHKYWEPMPGEDEPWLSDEHAFEEFEPALMRSVARCMDTDAQGIMLSGGVDSVTVAALAAEYARGRGAPPLVAVSARTGQALVDEERMQARVAEALAMPHVISTTLEWKQGRDDVSLSLEATPELPAPTHIWWVGTYMRFYRRTATDGLHVLLTGAGGDNWLGVADAHAADLMSRFRFDELLRFMKASTRTGGTSIRGAIRSLIWTNGIRLHLDSMWARVAPAGKARYHGRKWRARLPNWLCPDRQLKAELVDHLLSRRTPALTESGSRPRSYYLHSLRSLNNPYLHHENETAFHVESQCGLRLLSPYHDRRLVSFFNRIAPNALVHQNRYKGLLRPVVAKHLPNLGLEDQRKDYPPELHNRMLQDLRGSIAEAWSAESFDALDRLGIVDRAAVRSEGADTSTQSFEALAAMFMAMSEERWVEAHTSD